jgi:RNA-directed DNA polymerase
MGKSAATDRHSLPSLTHSFTLDFVVLHDSREVVQLCHEFITVWLQPMGLELKPSKTRIPHTLAIPEGTPGCDFLGFGIRQDVAGKTRTGKDPRGRLQGFKTRITPSTAAIQRHVQHLREIVHRHKHVEQAALITHLNPVIRGWARYYAPVISAHVFRKLDHVLYTMLRAWAGYRHGDKSKHWTTGKYWRVDEGRGWLFQPAHSDVRLSRHTQTPIRCYVKVQGSRSPYDGDWVYWSARLGRPPEVSSRVARLLKSQQGKCPACGLFFTDGERLEVDHVIPRGHGGSQAFAHLQLLHRHCHQPKTAREDCRLGSFDKRHGTEEPCAAKVARTVL